MSNQSLERFAFCTLFDLVYLVRPIAFVDLDPIVYWLEAFGVEAVHAMLSTLHHGDYSGLAQRAEMLGDGGLSHFHTQDDFVDGVFLAIGQDGNDFAPPWFGDGGE